MSGGHRARRLQAAFDEYVAELNQAGLKPEELTGVGEAAVLTRPGDLLTVVVRRADGVLSVFGHEGVARADPSRATVDEPSGFSYAVVIEPEFKSNRLAGPAEYFNAERQLLGHVQPVSGLGLEAAIVESKYTPPDLLVRRSADVLRLTCHDWTCSRESALALMRRALAR